MGTASTHEVWGLAWSWGLSLAVMKILLAPQIGQVQVGAIAPSSELLQIGTRYKATLSILFHCPPAILPF